MYSAVHCFYGRIYHNKDGDAMVNAMHYFQDQGLAPPYWPDCPPGAQSCLDSWDSKDLAYLFPTYRDGYCDSWLDYRQWVEGIMGA